MSEFKLISPLLDHMEVVRCVQSRSGISVYLLRNADTGRQYMLKHISVPESQTQVDALLFTGAAADLDQAQSYYEQVVEDYRDEFAALDLMRGSANFATYEDYQVCAKDEGVGFEIYLLSQKWPTLVEYLAENAMTHLKALNLGLDLCTALCDLRAQGLIHRDIKPENIYLNGLNGFMLGDLGVARIDQLKYCAMPERMITEYTAPELSDILNPFNTTVDIYSIGMVLYRILNGNHGPFEDESTSAKAANRRRISGEPLPAPLYSDYELTEIILKACAYEPADRYQTPDELMQDLVLYMKRNSVTDSLVVPPIITDPSELVPPESADEEVEPVRFADVEAMDEAFVENFSPDTQSLNAIIEEVQKEEQKPAAPSPRETSGSLPAFAAPRSAKSLEDDEEPTQPLPEVQSTPENTKPVKKTGKRQKLWIPITIAVILVAVIGVSLYFLVFGGPALQIRNIEVTDRGTDFLTVFVDTGGQEADLTIQCLDTYGNLTTQPYTGENVTFSDLSSGAQYTISVLSNTRKKLTGTTSTMVATVATTEIIDFTATSSMAGQVELNFSVSGPMPEEWTVQYAAEGAAPQEKTFTGKSVKITGLESNAVYTFELLPPEGITLSGTTTLEFTSSPEVEVENLEASVLSATSVLVTWQSSVEDAEVTWSVTCTSSDGTTKTQTTDACEATFEDLNSGETYTVTVTSSGTLSPATTTVTPTAAVLTAFSAVANGTDTIEISWTSEAADAVWQLVYSVKGSTDLAVISNISGSTYALECLIPGETYTVELRSGAGEKLGGNAAAEVALEAPGKFNSYGASRFFMGLFLRPSKDNWTRTDLSTGVTEFTSDQKMAFAIESLTGRDSSEDPVRFVAVVRDSAGTPISSISGKYETWDAMWQDDVFCYDAPATPTEAGTYILELYLNGQSAGSREFTIQ